MVLVLSQRVIGIAHLFHFIIDTACLRCEELNTYSRLNTADDRLIQNPRATGLAIACDVVHQLEWCPSFKKD